ncbi:MAG: TIGR04283 family arsenosugar biosynthesis glycosyltransferase [Paracoccaceae bacterium]
MSAPLSVIVPTWQAADRLGPCLGALSEALFDGLILEVILADGGSGDQIAEVADAVGARLVTAPKGRGRQLAAGARAANGAWLLFLHADSVMGHGWHLAVRKHMAEARDCGGFFQLAFDTDQPVARVVAGWANLRARWLRLPFGDQGLLISRQIYEQTGGYPETDLMEDIAIARALGRKLRPLGAQIVTSAERYQREGWFRRGGRNLYLQTRYFMGADPKDLATRYRRNT